MPTIRTLLVALFLLVPSLAAAQEQQMEQTLIATVNINKAAIVSQTGNTFTIDFTISNRQYAQSGVKYGVQLARETAQGGQLIVDEHVYDEELMLQENSSVQRQITYTAPSQFSGEYSLYLTSENENGFPFAVALIDAVTLTAEAGIAIQPESCSLQVAGTSYQLDQVPTVASGQVLTVSCTATNTTGTAVSALPWFETRYENEYGEVVPGMRNNAPAVMIESGAQESVSFNPPLAQKPGVYEVAMRLEGQAAQSNIVSVRYVIPGAAASILNASLDKTSYDKGDIATLSLVWKSTIGADMTLTGTITNRAGLRCAAPISQTISMRDAKPVTSIIAAITRQCKNPQITITLTDGAGTVLDVKEFNVESQTAPSGSRTVWWVIGILAALTIIGVYAMRKGGDKPTTPPLAMVALFLGAGLLFIPAHAHADTYSAGPGGQMLTVVNLHNNVSVSSSGTAQYAVGQPDEIRTTLRLQNTTNFTYPIRATVRTDGSVGVTLYSGNLAANTYSQLLDRFFPVPSIGQYTMDFSTIVYVNTILGPSLASSGTIEGGSYPTAAQACATPSAVRTYYQEPTAPPFAASGVRLFENDTLTIPVNTQGRWSAFLYNVGSGSSTRSAIQTASDGRITSYVNC